MAAAANTKFSAFLISGGASGLGAATARVFARAGLRVGLMDLNEEAGEALAKELGPSKAFFLRTDVTSEVDVQAAVDRAYADFGTLNGAINCAGLGVAGKMLGSRGPHPLDLFNKVLQINVGGSFNVMRLAAAAMKEKTELDAKLGRGLFVNTASVAAYDGQIGQTAYASSKGAIVGLTLPAARELSEHGIRVCAIAPGIFDTPMLAGLPEKARESLGRQVPFPPRLGDPEEYGKLALSMVENTMLNGEVVRLDGALRMGAK
jgi:NAD(P)-dependent dehydrogenase (short-subunit alcohol dehydrogenase family)